MHRCWNCGTEHECSASIDALSREYNTDKKDVIEAIYQECHHTKYVGCDPCIHDEMVSIIDSLENGYE